MVDRYYLTLVIETSAGKIVATTKRDEPGLFLPMKTYGEPLPRQATWDALKETEYWSSQATTVFQDELHTMILFRGATPLHRTHRKSIIELEPLDFFERMALGQFPRVSDLAAAMLCAPRLGWGMRPITFGELPHKNSPEKKNE